MQKRIAHITDTHLGDPTALDRDINPAKNLEAVLEDIAARKIDELVFTGDIGAKESYKWLFDRLEQYKPGFKVVLGNHDEAGEALAHFRNSKTEGNGELYYSNEDEVYKYIFLDSSASALSDAQFAWLEAETATQKKIIVFIHHPILGFATGMDIIYPLQGREKVNALLQQCKGNVTVFCGHYHMPDKRQDGKITQYITPSVAFQVKKNSQKIDIDVKSFGYRIITIDDNAVKTTLVLNRYDHFSPKAR
jgi:Icc protein